MADKISIPERLAEITIEVVEPTLTAAIGQIDAMADDQVSAVRVCSVPPVGFEPTLSEV